MSDLLEQLSSVSHDQEMFYDMLLEIGGDMTDTTDIRTNANYVSGCQSSVWVTAEKLNERGVQISSSQSNIMHERK